MATLVNYQGNPIDIEVSGGGGTARYSIPFGKLVKGTIANSQVTETESSNMVIMKDTFVMPYKSAKLTFNLTPNYKAKVYYGTPHGRTGTTTNASEYVGEELSDGDTFTFPYAETTLYDEEYFYRVAFVKSGIALDDVLGLIESGDIDVWCDKADEDVLCMNADELMEANARKWMYGNISGDNPSISRLPVIVHISDLHSDAIRYTRAIKAAELLSATLVNTGDTATQCPKDGYSWPFALIKGTSVLPIVSQGNHDAVNMTQAAFEADFFTDFYNKYGYSQLSAYYYKDDTVNLIRYINLNSCDYETTDSAGYRISRISERQRKWYAQTLLATPANYKVVVSIHQPPTYIDAVEGATDFFSSRAMRSNEIIANGGEAVVGITDAFIAGTSVTVGDTTVDFSQKNLGAEFVMYLTGHTHADYIGHVHGAAQTQLCCNIGTGNIMHGSGFTYDYISHNLGLGKQQDLFNVYVIDRSAGTVMVIRIGADTDVNGGKRQQMTIAYK